MILKKCTFDELPDAMQMHILYIRKIPVGQYRLAIWSEKDTLYYNDLKESEIQRFLSLIESEKRHLDGRAMNGIYKKYGSAVYFEVHDAHAFLLKKRQDKIAEEVVAGYMPIIEKAMDRPSIPLNHSLLKAMSHAADKGTDTYMKSKYMLLAASREHPGDRHFFEVLFDRVEKKRPPLIAEKK